MSKIFKKIGQKLPEKLRAKVDELMKYAGKEGHYEEWLGRRFIYSVSISIGVFILLYILGSTNWLYNIVAGIATFLILFGGTFASLSLKADKRAKEIEDVLPTALQLISANIRAGMTPDRAIWSSARPEFGAFEEEIKRVGSESLGGIPLHEAFLTMKGRVRSRVVERTIRLIVEGMQSGGELAKLLNETAEEIKAMDLLRKELNANVAMYTMFITFASMVGAPLLFGISTFFVDMLSSLTSAIGVGTIAEEAAQRGVSIMAISTEITPAFLMQFSITCIVITTFFAALLVGLVKNGNEKSGLEYAPIYVVMGLIIFFLVRYVVTSMFGSIIIT